MASLIRKEKKNGEVVYRIQISLGYDKENHKQNTKVITFQPNQHATPKQQKSEAEKFGMEWENKLKNGESYAGLEMSFVDFAEKWKSSEKDRLAYSTYENYLQQLKNSILPFFGNKKVGKIKTPLIEEFYKTLIGKYSNGSMEKIAHVLSGMFQTAIRWQMIEINPCKNAKLPKNKEEEKTLKYLTPEQSLMFLQSLDMTFETVINGHKRIDDTGKPYLVPDYTEKRKLPLQLIVFLTLSLYCGFRRSETLALHWSDVDFENKKIRITKAVSKAENGITVKKPKTAASVRTVSLPDAVIPLLTHYKAEYNLYRIQLGTAWQGEKDGNLFIQYDGKLMGQSTPYQAYKRHIKRYNEWIKENPEEAKKQGLEQLPDVSLHGLRHSCATLLNYLDVNVVDISKILGHAKTSTTMDIYAHSFEEQINEAANRLNDFLVKNEKKYA